MRTIIHLSDLHFGRTDDSLLLPLRTLVHALAPDLVVVSGDLTQRARNEQFIAARAFLDSLPAPQIVVPGNHDISLYNVFRRFARPLARYQRFITTDLEPAFIDDEIAVLGVNTARSLTFKDGRVNRDQAEQVRARFAGLPEHITRIVVTHHPFDLPSRFAPEELVARAPMAMHMFAESGVDLLLAGHMHVSHAANSAIRYPLDAYAALVVQAGTATSTRARGEVNTFNLLRVDAAHVALVRYGWDAATAQFLPAPTEHFVRSGKVWAAAAAATAP